MYFVCNARKEFCSIFSMGVFLVVTLSFEEVESIVDCAFCNDDYIADISLLYV